MNDFLRIFYSPNDGGGGAGGDGGEGGTGEEGAKEPFKTFESEDDYNREIRSQRSKAKKEVLDELGVKSIDEAKTNLSKSATLETELNETKSKYQTLEQDYHLSKAGVKDEYKEEVITLAKAKMNDETTFDKALEAVIQKMPFVTGKAFQGQVGGEGGRHDEDGTKTLTEQLSKKYPWIKG
ncbi:MAG: hypothetical protein GX896_02360 [Clostridiales bacterium]|nr:hypothetical protein [Clostridiales bacterium]